MLFRGVRAEAISCLISIKKHHTNRKLEVLLGVSEQGDSKKSEVS